MNVLSVSIVIARAPDEVFAYMNDISREHEWQPHLISATQDPPGPIRVGTRRRYVNRFMGRSVRNTYVVTAVEAGRRVACETESGSDMEARTEVAWEAEGAGTRVSMRVEGKPKGILKLLPRRALEFAFRQEIEATLERAKDRLEGGSG